MSAIKFEAAQCHLLVTFSYPSPSSVLKLPQTSNLVSHFDPSCPRPLFRSKAKCDAIDMKMPFHSHANETRFHKKVFALSLVLKVRVFGTPKRPVS